MKKLYLLSICLIVGCSSYEIQTFSTQAGNTKVITLKINHKVMSGDLDNFATIYKREITNGQGNPTEIMFYFKAQSGYPDFKERFSIKIDDTIHVLALTDRTSFMQPKEADLIGLFGVFSNMKILKGKITLTQEVEKILKTAKSLEFILYTAVDATTLPATKGQLEDIKEFLNYNPR
jgi:hypothetical protein